ncbi:MAG: GNAT family N-acetyltransferase, partial [Pseudomonadota bacterium]
RPRRSARRAWGSGVSAERVIRRGALADAPACAAILNDWIDDREWMPRVHTREEVTAFYQDFVFQKREVWVTGDPIDGYIGLNPETGEVTTLYTATPGQGVGKVLLDHAKQGRSTLQLWTFQANDGARRFYVREGFREVEFTEGDNEEGLPDVRLRWDRWPVRQAEVSDAAACARVVHGWVSATQWMPNRFSEAEFTEMIATAIPVREIYVAGEPVQGYLSLDPENSVIMGLYVEARGTGLGKSLVDAVKSGRDGLTLWTHTPNTRAHAFYEREGFRRTGQTRDGDDGHEEFEMEWRR